MVFRYLSLFLLCVGVRVGEDGCLMLDCPVAACVGGDCSPGCRCWCLWWRLFVVSFFPLDTCILDEIWDLIESVFEGFLTYSYTKPEFWTFFFYIHVMTCSPNFLPDV